MRFDWRVSVDSEGEDDGQHSRFWAVVLGVAALCLLVLVIAGAAALIEGIILRR